MNDELFNEIADWLNANVCHKNVVTRWDEIQLNIAHAVGDVAKFSEIVFGLANTARIDAAKMEELRGIFARHVQTEEECQ